MKKILLSVVVLLFPVLLLAQTRDVVYLKNGNVVKGIITQSKSNGDITIVTENGKTLNYTQFDVREVKQERVTETPRNHQQEYTSFEDQTKGYFFAAELSGGVTLNEGGTGFPIQLGVVNGYRFCEFLAVGVGLGARYYAKNDDIRARSSEWAFPIYVDVRGNIISHQSRNLVPYWSFDTGYTIGDDRFFFSPTIGLSIGGNRNDVLVGLSYLGQLTPKTGISGNRMLNALCLKVGFQF